MMKRAVAIYWIIFFAFLIPFILGKNIVALAEDFHDLIDAITITFSFYVSRAINMSSPKFTYGMHRLEVLSALVNSLVIVLGSFFTLYFSILGGENNYSLIVIFISIISIIMLLSIHEDDEKDLNKKAVVSHSLFDIIAYVIGILALIVYLITHSYLITVLGVIGIVITSVLISLNPLKQSFLIILEGSPVNVNELEEDLKVINPGVHHIHVWAICGHMSVATIHVEVSENLTVKELDLEREKLEKFLKEKYGITHVTIQFESKRAD